MGQKYLQASLKTRQTIRTWLNLPEGTLSYIDEVIRKKFAGKQIRTSEKYSVLSKKIKAFRKDKPLPIEELTTSFLKGFQLSERGRKPSELHSCQSEGIKDYHPEGCHQGRQDTAPEKNPFIWFTMPKVLPTIMKSWTLMKSKG